MNSKISQNSAVIWFTGLSGSGKSTLASALDKHLAGSGFHTFILDGDVVRDGLNKDLGFSEEDRQENIRRLGEVARLFADAGVIVIASVISPYKQGRDWLKERIGRERFIEVFVDCPLDVCVSRDVKGLYKKVETGEILNFTGVDSPYEPPANPDLTLRTHENSIEECLDVLLEELLPRIQIQP